MWLGHTGSNPSVSLEHFTPNTVESNRRNPLQKLLYNHFLNCSLQESSWGLDILPVVVGVQLQKYWTAMSGQVSLIFWTIEHVTPWFRSEQNMKIFPSVLLPKAGSPLLSRHIILLIWPPYVEGQNSSNLSAGINSRSPLSWSVGWWLSIHWLHFPQFWRGSVNDRTCLCGWFRMRALCNIFLFSVFPLWHLYCCNRRNSWIKAEM